jgi:hypothetical protein
MPRKNKNKCVMMCGSCQSGGAVYGLGFIGAVIYYISTATGFWMGVLGVLKAICLASILRLRCA